MYKLLLNPITNQADRIALIEENNIVIFGMDNLDSSNYQNFKKQINADEAQLEDADGNLMTAEQAKAYVATLP